jgi:hypothetical protein
MFVGVPGSKLSWRVYNEVPLWMEILSDLTWWYHLHHDTYLKSYQAKCKETNKQEKYI